MSKKSKRSKVKYPALDKSCNLKSRRDYMDNIHYVEKLKDDELKEWLNDFNQSYYCNSTNLKYGNTEIIERRIDKEEEGYLKSLMSGLKSQRRKIWDKPAHLVSPEDRIDCSVLDAKVEAIENFLDRMIPMRKNARSNYARNEDFLNMSKASNTYDLVSWETLRDDELNDIMDESIFIPKDWDDKD